MPSLPPEQILPAEWYPQDALQLTWPHADNGWPDGVASAEALYIQLCEVVSPRQRLIIAATDAAHVQNLLNASQADVSQIQIYQQASNDCWVRDHGPIGVITGNRRPRLLDFTFNGWGNKYPSDADNQCSQRLKEAGAYTSTELMTIPLVLEGGSIESNGIDTLMTTSRCLLNPNRNAGLDRNNMTERLQALFGVSQVLWLDHGDISGDDTDGHIDMLARFTDPNTIAYCHSENSDDIDHASLQDMEQQLQTFCNLLGEPYRLIPLPMPTPVHNAEGHRLPASYANFLIINGAVLVPIYNQDRDELALSTLQGCFPDRQIIGINCLPLIHQYGSLHCATMQIMAGVLNP